MKNFAKGLAVGLLVALSVAAIEVDKSFYPDILTEKVVTLSNATVSTLNLGEDVKHSSIYCTGDTVSVNVDIFDGDATHFPGDLVTTDTDERALTIVDGTTFVIAQNTRYNYAYLKITDESGSATCRWYKGQKVY